MVLNDKKLQLVIAGGVIDNEYADSIRKKLSRTSFATWLREVPHERIGKLYERADLVLNCSQSESMPNSLMEAMAIGRAVLAAKIPGNRSLVQNGKTGWLYDSEADFRRLVMQIRENVVSREEVGRKAKESYNGIFFTAVGGKALPVSVPHAGIGLTFKLMHRDDAQPNVALVDVA
jgi:glycosyltransferase involved in cell wall biosynthesis